MEENNEYDLQQSLTKLIEQLGCHLNCIHKCSTKQDEILTILQNILMESIDNKSNDFVISFLHEIVIPKMKNILEIVYILEKKPWRAEENDIKIGDRIPPPPLILSISHFRIIYTIVEILWVWGIKSYLKNIIEFNFIDDAFPKTLLLNQNDIECMISTIYENNETKCLQFINIMGLILENKLFKATMLKRNLKRIIVALLIFTNKDLSKQFLIEDTLVIAHNLIDKFTVNFPERIMVIKALRWSSSGSKFLGSSACNIMTKILLTPGGLETVLVGYLEGLNDDSKTLTLQMNVAKLIAAVPTGYNKESYLENICKQLVQLMSLGCEKEDKLLMKVCIMIINRIAQSSPLLCDKFLTESFSEPLMRLGLCNKEINISDEINDDKIIATEAEVDSSIRIIYNIINIAPLTPALTASISRIGLGQILITIYCQTTESAKSCQWLQLLQHFSIQYIYNLDSNISSTELRNVILFPTNNKVCSGSNGGICIKSGSPDHRRRINIANNIKNKQNITLTPESILQFKRCQSLIEEKVNDENNDVDISELQQIEEMIMNSVAFSNEEFNDSNSSNQDVFSGHRMMIVGARAKIISDLLQHIEKMSSTKSKLDPEEQIDKDLSNDVASKLFIATLQSFLGISNLGSNKSLGNMIYDTDLNETEDCEKIVGFGLLRGLDGIILVTLQGHCEISMLLRNGVQVLKLLGSFLHSHLKFLEDDSTVIAKIKTNTMIEDLDESEENDRNETCSTVLSLLASILALGNSSRPIEEENEIKSLLMPLQRISMKEKDQSIAQSASDTAFMILNRAAGGFENKNNKASKNETKTMKQTIDESREHLNSNSPAMRSYAIRLISIAFYQSENKNESVVEEVFDILYKMLNDNDSFVYLHVLQVLTRFADYNRQKIFHALLSAFQLDNENDSLVLSERRRSLIGEALSSILRRSGDIAPKFVPFIVVACNKIIKKRLNTKDDSRIEELVDLSSMRINNNNNDNNIEIDEDLVSRRKKERNLEKNEQKIIEAALSADNALLRQSAVSLLAESISTAGWSAAIYMIDTLDIAVGILTFETKSNQSNRSIRRSAVFLLKYILEGLKDKIFEINDSGLHLKTIYRALKNTEYDKDNVVCFHSKSGLGILDELMRSQLFPSESQYRASIPKIDIFTKGRF